MAEPAILQALERQLADLESLKVSFQTGPFEWGIQLDGYWPGTPPILVEAWAHIGQPKGSQPDKVLGDCCKLLYAERLAKQKCRKIIAVACPKAVGFLSGDGWKAKFVKEYGIEVFCLDIGDSIRGNLITAQGRQGWT